MKAYVALLRAVNLGASSTVRSADLRAIGEGCGFSNVRTFLASGNLLFTSGESESKIGSKVRSGLEEHLGKAATVHVRSASEMKKTVSANPFGDRPGNRTLAYFISGRPDRSMIEAATNVGTEEMALGPRCIYIAYPEGMGQSKLALPVFREGTGRNMNSVAKMADLLAGMR